MNQMQNRRKFTKTLGLCAIGAALGTSPGIVRGYSKNETISLGIIGAGGRARNDLIPALLELPGVRIDAVCDVYESYRRSAEAQVGGREREVFTTQDHRELLERKDIDAVVIATPDHWHAPMTIDACEAGKDVFLEKPAMHKLEEARPLIEAKNRTGRIVQVGAQQRSMPHIAELRRLIATGELDLGEVNRIHMQWNRNKEIRRWEPRIKPEQVDWKRFLGNAPDQPFDPFRMRNWRWMWDFGNGALSDLMVHWLDATNWIFDLPQPDRIVTMGGNYASEGIWECPDTIQSIFSYQDRKLQIDFETTFSNDHEKGSMHIMGRNATVYIDRARFEVTDQLGEKAGQITRQQISSEGPRGEGDYADYNANALHLEDWLNAVRERREPIDPLEEGVRAAEVAIYGNLAYHENRAVEIPPFDKA